jgi:ferrochelatase
LKKWRWVPELNFINSYHDYPAYLDAVAESIREHRQSHPSAQRLLMSFHGIPEKYFLAGDPYFCQCQRTARELAGRLELDDDEWQLSFQSRFGRQRWLTPYTDKTLQEWAAQGITDVDVVCPGFSIDCLETLEEITLQNAEIFRAAGGRELRYIPALNDRPSHARMLAGLIVERTQAWLPPVEDAEREARYQQRKAEFV